VDSNKSHRDTFDEKALRRAFKDWDSLKALGEHPLVNLAIVIELRLVKGTNHGSS
jgi:hypothetical protein